MNSGNINMKKDEVLEILYALHAETERLYHENGKNDFDAGRLDGIGWAIEEIKKESTT